MLNAIKNYTIWLMLTLLFTSCSTPQEKRNEKQPNADIPDSYSHNDIVLELTKQQQSAFDALNTLQTSTDEMSRLYSTFANITQPCYPADTSFIITQTELLEYMKQFVTKHCQNLKEDIRNELAETSVLAQEEYSVLYCGSDSPHQNYENGLPMVGTWVMPNVLGRRDIIIVW